MKLVAVSVIKNEADIVEAFVRHTARWVDHHLIFDHDSTDGTREILGELAREGLPVSLFTDHALANLQQARSNALTRLAGAEFGADWILPLDADEILVAPSRLALESALGDSGAEVPATLPLANYHPTECDDPTLANPILRIRHRSSLAHATRKVVVPRRLAADPAVTAGKGSHALYRDGAALAGRPLPDGIHLAHFALRSLGQQVLRVVTAELQKLARGQAHAGLDVHYRLGFQLLAEQPELFQQTLASRASDLTAAPVPYLGGALRHAVNCAEWMRISRALLPFLEQLAHSHGELLDRAGGAERAGQAEASLQRLPPEVIPPAKGTGAPAFDGFETAEGLDRIEGPFAAAFLPHFRWGFAPETTLRVTSSGARRARLQAEALTYWEHQAITVVVNGVTATRLELPRVNQKERLDVPLELVPGANTIQLRYDTHQASAADPRPLAVIFLSLRLCFPPP